jgi:hypothetical protein
MSTFLAWQRPGAHALTTEIDGARRKGAVQLQLTSMTSGANRSVTLPFALFGAADVSGLRQGAIRRRHPAPGVADAAPELAAHVEFAAADLPWRYSPAAPTGAPGTPRMLPWLVLLAGNEDDITLVGRRRVRVAAEVLKDAPLERSYQWVHVHQDDGGGTLARILTPCKLDPRSACRAALVPAYRFKADGTLEHAWNVATVAAPLELPLYDTWTFATGEADDFPILAARLNVAQPEALGDGFGQTTIRLRDRAEQIHTTGALMRPKDIDSFETAPLAGVSDVIAAWPVAQAGGRWVLAPPAYDLPWRLGAAAAAGWPTELLRDPRRRGAAGLGAWCAIDQQDQLADGARRQAGAIEAAAHDFRALSLGLSAGRSLFKHRLPSDSLERLAVLGPLLRRLPALAGGTADVVLRGRTPRLHPAVLSGAMRRTIRPGTALAVSAQGLTIAGMLEAANACPDPERPTAFTETLRTLQGEPSQAAIAAVVERWQRELGDFARRAFGAGGGVWSHARGLAAREQERRPCRPVALAALGDALARAVDPSRATAPAIRRVRERYKGIIDPFPAPVFEPELDLPLAPVIAKLAPHWLLPGRGLLPADSIVAMASNPRFVESALTGANQRTLAELRWRNVRVRSGWSPLRRFWPRPQGPDVTPLRSWTGELAHQSHRPAGEVANLLVVVIRSPILRRYPGTGVYLLAPSVDVQQLIATSTAPPEAERVLPIFKGALEPDLHYIGFPRTPKQAEGHHLVFEEPMAEPRFRLESPLSEADDVSWQATRHNVANGAIYAQWTFHRRTIVVIKLL